MRYCTVGETITETTRSIVGMPISPHLFRTAGASTAAVYGGDNPHLASAILHHKNARITEQNYSRAKSMNAAKSYSTIIDTYRNN
jgi:integrase